MTDVERVKNAQRLTHILEAIRRIRRSLSGVDKDAFAIDEDKQGNVVHCFEIIGEAANHVADEIVDANPGIPWAAIIGMRNNLIHGYNEIDYEIVWDAAQNDLEGLEESIEQILSEIGLPEELRQRDTKR